MMMCDGKINCLHTAILVPLLYFDNVMNCPRDLTETAAFLDHLKFVSGIEEDIFQHLTKSLSEDTLFYYRCHGYFRQ